MPFGWFSHDKGEDSEPEEEEDPTWDSPTIDEYVLPDGRKIMVQLCNHCEGQGDIACELEPNPYGVLRYTCPVCMGFGILRFTYDDSQTWIPNT